MGPRIISIVSPRYRISLNRRTGSLRSFASRNPEQEFIDSGCGERPIFTLKLSDAAGKPGCLSARQAMKISFTREDGGNRTTIRFYFEKLGGQSINARVKIDSPKKEALTYWTIDIENNTGRVLEWIDFPCVTVSTKLSGRPGSERLLWSRSSGILFDPGKERLPETLQGDDIPGLTSEKGREISYPGIITAQLMACYNDKAGLYTAAYDPDGNLKIIAPFQIENAVRLTYVHFRGHANKQDSLPYPVVLGVFQGDWYAAAEIYRGWAQTQPWCKKPLPRNTPSWWLDSPIVTTFLPRGQYDCKENVSPNPDYLPLSNSLPYLDRLSRELESPLVPVIYSWEKHAPWTGPDAFPPYGGAKEFRRFFAAVARRGWHGGVCANGTRWVTAHHKMGYDGSAYFREHNGEKTVCRHPDGKLWAQEWDATWRKSYACCAGQPRTKKMVLRQIKMLLEYGCDFLYFYDQNGGGESFSCYARNHNHPPYPGIWQIDAMKRLLEDTWTPLKKSGRKFALLPEGPAAEPFIPYYNTADDVRHQLYPLGGEPVSLYNFLYHEYIQNFDSNCTEINDPDALLLKTALACVRGDGLQIILREKGRINRGHQVMWERTLLDQESCITLMRRVNKLRRGKGKKYLVLGRMQPPVAVQNVPERLFTNEGTTEQLVHKKPILVKMYGFPAVLSGSWRSPDGLFSHVLVNYGREPQNPIISLKGTGPATVTVTMVEAGKSFTRQVTLPGDLSIPMPSLSVALIETVPS